MSFLCFRKTYYNQNHTIYERKQKNTVWRKNYFKEENNGIIKNETEGFYIGEQV